MRYIFLIILSLLSVSVFADTEQLEVDAVGVVDQWTNNGGDDKVDAVDNNNDAKYIEEASAGQDQYYTLTNTSSIEASSIIDSVKVVARCEYDNDVGNIAIYIRLGASTTLWSLGVPAATWTTYTSGNLARPGGGDWIKSSLDSSILHIEWGNPGLGTLIKCSRFYLIAYYSEPPVDTDTLPLDTFITQANYRDRQLFCEVDTINNHFTFLGWETSTAGEHECSLRVTLPDLMTVDNWSDSTWPDLDSMPQVDDTVDYFIIANDSDNIAFIALYKESPGFDDDYREYQFAMLDVGFSSYPQGNCDDTWGGGDVGTRDDTLQYGTALYHSTKWGDISYIDSAVKYTTGKFLYIDRAVLIDSLLDTLWLDSLGSTQAINLDMGNDTFEVRIDSTFMTDATYPVKLQVLFNKQRYGSMTYGFGDFAEQDVHLGYAYYGVDNFRMYSWQFYASSDDIVDVSLIRGVGRVKDSLLEHIENVTIGTDATIYSTFFSSLNPIVYNDTTYFIGVGDLSHGVLGGYFDIMGQNDTSNVYVATVENTASGLYENLMLSCWMTTFQPQLQVDSMVYRNRGVFIIK